jgi:hypothetical protein
MHRKLKDEAGAHGLTSAGAQNETSEKQANRDPPSRPSSDLKIGIDHQSSIALFALI